jgi:hypothetical protein
MELLIISDTVLVSLITMGGGIITLVVKELFDYLDRKKDRKDHEEEQY